MANVVLKNEELTAALSLVKKLNGLDLSPVAHLLADSELTLKTPVDKTIVASGVFLLDVKIGG
jgi:hypothetical protein